MERAVRVEVERKFKAKKNRLYITILILLFTTVMSIVYATVVTIENKNIVEKIINYDGSLFELKQEVNK